MTKETPAGPSMGRLILPEAGPWLRGKARYEAGWIVLEAPDEYSMIEEVGGATFALAGIHEPADAVAFAERYGLLWHGPGADELRESFARWQEEAARLLFLMECYQQVYRAQRGDQDAIRILWELWEQGIRPAFAEVATTDADLLDQASVVIADSITAGLTGVEQGFVSTVIFEDGRPDQFAFSPRLPHLLAAVYLELAMLLNHRQPLHSCVSCGRLFLGTDPRRRYCSESCANRVRYRRWAERRRAETAS